MENQNEIVAENKEIVQNQTEPPVVQEQETQEQINWRKFREAREAERKQKEAAEKKAAEKEAEAAALKAAMETLLNKNVHHEPQYDSYIDEDEDAKIQKKVEEALQARERQIEEQRKQRELQEFPQKLASTFNDFNDVCTTENLDYLEYHYPEVANAFKYRPDGFDKWADIYKAVKRFVPNTNSKKDQLRAEKNLTKPQSMAVGGVTQTGDSAPMKLDDKRRADNWARMQRVMKGG